MFGEEPAGSWQELSRQIEKRKLLLAAGVNLAVMMLPYASSAVLYHSWLWDCRGALRRALEREVREGA